MSKGIIKEKKPQTLSRWEVLKAWIAESIASIKRSLKDGGWKGTALEAAAVTSMVGAGIVLVACVPTEVQIEKVTSESEVNRLVSANFSEKDAVREEMTKQYGALSDFEYNNGKATANVERNGKSYAVSAEIDLGASDFEVTKYTNAELSGNNLTYTSEGQDVSENVSDKIVVEENGVIYVIDPSEALNTISIAVSDAILTENVDPENPGGEENPDPDEPENPGGEDKPDPDEPENPGGEENPDPENPGGEENPDSQIETIDDINVIEQLLSQKDLTIEALAKAAATAFYGQDNVSNLSYQNGIVSGQAKTAEGTVNFSANLDLSATDFEGEFYAGAELSADGKTLTFYQNGNLTTLTITEDMAVIETADGVNILDTAAAEQMVANKFETTNNETSVPSQDITFDSWQELVDLIGTENESTLEQAMAEIIKKNLVTLDFVQWVVGSYSGRPETTLENTDTLKLAFKLNQNQEIESISWMGVRYAFRSDTEDHLRVVTVPLTSPISYKTIKVTENLAEDQKNDNCISFGDITLDLSNYANEILYDKNAITVDQLYYGSHSLTETNLAYFDLCMPLAIEAGLIDADANIAFCFVQGSSSTNATFGSTYNVFIRFVDLNTNQYYRFGFVFDSDGSKDQVTLIENAISREEFMIGGGSEETIISGDMIFEFEEALDGIVKYTISAENQK